MSGASMKMNWGGLTRLVDAPGRVTGATKKAVRDIGEMLVSSTQQRFEDGKGPDGKPWKPSARAKTEKGQTLVDTGRLRNSIGYQASEKAIVVGTNVEYGAIHQFGGKTEAHVIRAKNKKALAWPGGAHPVKEVHHPGSDIPARPYLGFSTEDRAEAKSILEAMMARILTGGGK
jgi:phage virion morphogenesis protein